VPKPSVPSRWKPTYAATIATPSAENSSSTADERKAMRSTAMVRCAATARHRPGAGRGIHRAERAQRREAPQAVEQEGVHAAQLHHLRLARGLGAPADDGHENGNERRREQQHQRGHPGERGHAQRMNSGTTVARQRAGW
jgi:hypothetical protein